MCRGRHFGRSIVMVKWYRMRELNFEQKFVERSELRERLKRREGLLVIDVRSAEEFAAGQIDGAVNILANELPGELSGGTTIVTVCNFGGARSCGAAKTTPRPWQ